MHHLMPLGTIVVIMAVWFIKSEALVKSIKTVTTRVLHCLRFLCTKSRKVMKQRVVDEVFMLSYCCRFIFGARSAYVHSTTQRRLGSVVTHMGWRSLRDVGLVVLGAVVIHDALQPPWASVMLKRANNYWQQWFINKFCTGHGQDYWHDGDGRFGGIFLDFLINLVTYNSVSGDWW